MLTTRVEEPVRERQRVRFGLDREHAVRDSRFLDAAPVLCRFDPEVGGPHLHAELAREEDRRDRGAAAEVEHAHPAASGSTCVSASVSHSTFGPMRFRCTHVASYAEARG